MLTFDSQLKSQGRGEILVSLCYQPAANRVTAVVLKARNLPKMDVTGLSGKLPINAKSVDGYIATSLLFLSQIPTSRSTCCATSSARARRRRRT